MAGLTLAQFNIDFPEFSTVSPTLVQLFLDMVNCGYQLTTVTNTCTLNIYYWLIAHLVATATQQVTGATAGASGSYMPVGSTAGLVSLTFQAIEGLSADQAFMLSTRYGQVFWMFSKQQYVMNTYFNVGCVRWGWWY